MRRGRGRGARYVERGAGPPVLLVHGLAVGRRGDGARGAGGGRRGARAIAYDRRGYGASGAPEPYGGTTVEEQAEDAAALLRRARRRRPRWWPATASARSSRSTSPSARRARPGASCSADPPLFALVPEATEACPRSARSSRRRCATGGPEAGVEAWLGGRVEGAALARARAAHRGFFADYAGLATWPVTPPRAARAGVPGRRPHRPATPPQVVAAADALAGAAAGGARAPRTATVAAALSRCAARVTLSTGARCRLREGPPPARRPARPPARAGGAAGRRARRRRRPPLRVPPSSRRGPPSSCRCRSRRG